MTREKVKSLAMAGLEKGQSPKTVQNTIRCLNGRCIQVSRNYTHWKLTTPKSGESRAVDMSLELTRVLTDLKLERQIEAGASGTDVPPWVFCNEKGGLLHPHNLRDRIFYGLLKKAGLRQVRFHDLRHSFASLLLQQGKVPCM